MIHAFSRRFALSTLIVFTSCLAFLPGAARAYPPDNLDQALHRSSDAVRKRIPLLIINPEQVRMKDDSWLKLNELFPDDTTTPPLKDVLPYYDRQMISCSSIQVVAPLTRVTINPTPGPVEEWARIGRERAARLLFGSLKPDQWAKASSADGLGLSDLINNDQRSWFNSLVPQPFILTQVISAGNGGYTSDPETLGKSSKATISPGQVRLRIHRNLYWMYGQKSNTGGFTGFGLPSGVEHKEGEAFWVQIAQTEEERTPESPRDQMLKAIRIPEPNRLKHSDLSFTNSPLVGKMITLTDAKTVGDLVQRVAEASGLELYADRRLSVLPVSIVGPEDAQADASDLLKAICYATTSAVRNIKDEDTKDSLYILTNDQVGLMTRRIRLAEWADDIQTLEGEVQTKFQDIARKGEYVGGIGFSPDSPFSISDNAMKAVEKQMTSPQDPNDWRNNSYMKIPVTELSPAGQAQVKKDLTERMHMLALGPNNANGDSNNGIDDKNVYANFSISLDLLVPGYGVFGGPGIGGLSDFLPPRPIATSGVTGPKPQLPTGPISLPTQLSGFVALQFAPRDRSELETATIWARRHGLTSLFICGDLWNDTQGKALWTAATEIGKRHGLAIYPSLSLLRVTSDSKTGPVSYEHNIMGETLRQYAYRRKDAPAVARNSSAQNRLVAQLPNEWLDVTDAKTREALSKRIGEIGGMPGVAGIVLRDINAPGMASQDDAWLDSTIAGLSAGSEAALRIAMIRKSNIDPIDLPSRGSMPPYVGIPDGTLIPFFPDDYNFTQTTRTAPIFHRGADGTWTKEEPKASPSGGYYGGDATAAWYTVRREANQKFVGDIRQGAKLPTGLPVIVSAPVDGGLPGWYGPWSDKEPLLPLARGEKSLMPLTMSTRSTPDSVRGALTIQMEQRMQLKRTPDGKETTPFNGVVFDITAVPLEKGLSLLDSLATK